ncbi:MAG: trypsin-like peptidase domain-containing protein [Acidobacteriota bacterium]
MLILACQVLCLLQAAGPMPPPGPLLTPMVQLDQHTVLPTPTPVQDVAGFVRDHSVTLLVQTGEGRLIRKGQAALSTPEGYIVTSLDLVVGGSSFLVSGGLVGTARAAKALAVSRKGKLAILQLEMKENERLGDQTPRTNIAPGVGDKVFGVGAEGATAEGKVLSVSEDADGTRLMKTSVALPAGSPLFNYRGQFVGVRRVSSGPQAGLVVFVASSVPGDWVDYFPSSLREPIRKKAIESLPAN